MGVKLTPGGDIYREGQEWEREIVPSTSAEKAIVHLRLPLQSLFLLQSKQAHSPFVCVMLPPLASLSMLYLVGGEGLN